MSRYQIDNSWDALMQPGRSNSYFRCETVPRVSRPTGDYCPDTAWWLAELSRLIYRQEEDECSIPSEGRTRRDVLQAVGADELHFFNRGGTQGALIKLPTTDEDSMYALVFRGTHDLRDWLSNLNVMPAEWPSGGKVHRGFVEALDQVWDDVTRALDEHVNDSGTVLFTGHSLGGALATLAAARRVPDALYSFGAPRVGDAAFNAALSGIAVHRIVNDRDLVTRVPLPGPLLRFTHPGRQHRLTPAGDRLVDPPARPFAARIQAAMARIIEDANSRSLREAPRALSDHAPINYVARLDRLRPRDAAGP